MSDIELSKGGVLVAEVQDLIDLDAQRIQNFWEVVDGFPRGLDSASSYAGDRVLKIGNYAATLEGGCELYLRSVESMTHHQELDSGSDHQSVTKAVDKTKTVLNRVMGLGQGEVRNLDELYPLFRHEYLPMFPIRAKNIFFGNGMERAINERDYQEAAAIAQFMGRAVVMPVVEVSSQLFGAVLRTRQDAREARATAYFKRNLASSKIKSPEQY